MPISCRIAVLLVAVAIALPAAALARAATPTQPLPTPSSGSSRPPVALGGHGSAKGSQADSGTATTRPRSRLPNTGTDPRLLFLIGGALTLLGAGLRLRSADADVY